MRLALLAAWVCVVAVAAALVLAFGTPALAQAPTAGLGLCRIGYLLRTKSGWYYAELRPAGKSVRPCLFTFARATTR